MGGAALIPDARAPKTADEGSTLQTTTAKMAAAGERDEGWDTSVSLDHLRGEIKGFAVDRKWEGFQTPRNLLLALVGEVGELSEIFQWKGEVDSKLSTFTDKEKAHLGEELSDVLLYLLRLSDVCGIDLGRAALDKMAKNRKKYPVEAAINLGFLDSKQ